MIQDLRSATPSELMPRLLRAGALAVSCLLLTSCVLNGSPHYFRISAPKATQPATAGAGAAPATPSTGGKYTGFDLLVGPYSSWDTNEDGVIRRRGGGQHERNG